MEERQQNYTIAEGYELPSKGLIYEGVSVNPHVELRSMTARDEMKRLNSSTTPFKTLATTYTLFLYRLHTFFADTKSFWVMQTTRTF